MSTYLDQRPVRMDPDRWCITCGALMRVGLPCDRQEAHQRIRAARSAATGTVLRRTSSRYVVRSTYPGGIVDRRTVAALSAAEAVQQVQRTVTGAERTTAIRIQEDYERPEGPLHRPSDPADPARSFSLGALVKVLEHQHRHDWTGDLDCETWPLHRWIPTTPEGDTTGGRGWPVLAADGQSPLWPEPPREDRRKLQQTVDAVDGARHRNGAAWVGSDDRVHGPAVDGPYRSAVGVTVHPHATPVMLLADDAQRWWDCQRTERRRRSDGSRPRECVGPVLSVLLPAGSKSVDARAALGLPSTATARLRPRRNDPPATRPVIWSGPAHALAVGRYPMPLQSTGAVRCWFGPFAVDLPPSALGAVIGTTAVIAANGKVRTVTGPADRTGPVPAPPAAPPADPVPAPVADPRRVAAANQRRRERVESTLAERIG